MSEIILRALHSSGRYPDYDVVTPTHRLHVAAAAAWTAALTSPDAPEHSEVAWLKPEEVALYAAVSLVEPDPSRNGWLWLAPASFEQLLPLPSGVADLTDAAIVGPLTEGAARLPPADIRAPWPFQLEFDQVPLGSLKMCQTIIEAVDVSDQLLLRSLAKFVTALNLASQRFFLEEAGISAIIALEAALQHLRHWLEETLQVPRTIADALTYVEKVFPQGTALVNYMRELYDIRTISVHPDNRFGHYWSPPMAVDDCYSCLELLVPLLRHILLDELPMGDQA